MNTPRATLGRWLNVIFLPTFAYTGVNRLRARATLIVSGILTILSIVATIGVFFVAPDPGSVFTSAVRSVF